MTAPWMPPELEIEARPVPASHLMRVRCSVLGCGGCALAAPDRLAVARCTECLGGSQSVPAGSMPYTVPVGYPNPYGAVSVDAGPVSEPFPAPSVSSRIDAVDWPGALPSGVVVPGPVVKLAETASAAGWRVRVQRSVGQLPHATHGRPGASREAFAVRGWAEREGIRRSFVAVRRGLAWDAVWMWGPGIGWFGHAGMTQLMEYISDPMRDESWFAPIRAKRMEQERQAKQRAKDRPKKAKIAEGM